MELRHIRSFLSLAKTLNFSRTSEIVHLSQPALTLQIQALENEIGVKLFERDRRKTVLTAAGAAFQREATGGLAQRRPGWNARCNSMGHLYVRGITLRDSGETRLRRSCKDRIARSQPDSARRGLATQVVACG